MITVSQVVNDILKKTPFLEEAIRKDLINFSAFARIYRKEIEAEAKKPVKSGAIVMALKRLSNKTSHNKGAMVIWKNPREIIVRSSLFEITLKHRVSRLLINKLSKIKKEASGLFLTITEGIFETTLIGSSEIKSELLASIKNESIVSEINGLSSITIRLSEDNVHTPGVYYMLLKQLAWENINIIEVISTTNEITVVLAKEDTETAFRAIRKLSVSLPLG